MDYQVQLVGLHEILATSPRGMKTQRIKDFAVAWNRSFATVCRDLSKLKKSERKPRSDKGTSKVSDAEVMLVTNIAVQSARQNGKQLTSVVDALENVKANGAIREDVSVSTVLRVAKQAGLHPKQLLRPSPYQRLRALHPNHVWMLDPSLCVLYYLPNDDKGLRAMDEKEFYKNKLANIAKVSHQRVWRYVVTDRATGAFFSQCYLASGENSTTLLTFLIEAFCKREDDPFHGIPKILMMDKGTANTSDLVVRWLTRLGVKVLTHSAGNPRAKGAVESMHNHIERKFEGRLYREIIRSIDALNAKMRQWMIYYNALKVHSRTKKTRYGLWLTIRPEQLVTCDRRLLLASVESKPDERVVRGDLTITYAVKGYPSRVYSLSELVKAGAPIRMGEPVQVSVNPFTYPDINVMITDRQGNVIQHSVQPLEMNEYGDLVDAAVIGEEYKSNPDTDVDKNRKKMAKQAYGVETLEEVDKLRKQRTPAFPGLDPMAEVKQAVIPDFIPKKSTPVEMPTLPRRPLPPVQAMKKIVAGLGRPLTAQEQGKIKAWYPDGITEEEVSVIIQRLNLSLVEKTG